MCEGRGNGGGKIGARGHVAARVVYEDTTKDAPEPAMSGGAPTKPPRLRASPVTVNSSRRCWLWRLEPRAQGRARALHRLVELIPKVF